MNVSESIENIVEILLLDISKNYKISQNELLAKYLPTRYNPDLNKRRLIPYKKKEQTITFKTVDSASLYKLNRKSNDEVDVPVSPDNETSNIQNNSNNTIEYKKNVEQDNLNTFFRKKKS